MVNASFTIEDGVGYVTIDRPEKLNAVDLPTKEAMTDRMETYRDDDDVRVVVLQSEGDRAFSAGGDLDEVVEVGYELEPFSESWAALFETMRGLSKPVVAKVDGYALGGGFDTLLYADVVIAAEDAKLGQPEIDLGLVNHFAPPVLLESVGLKTTLELLLLGETVTGAKAAEMGLVTRAVPIEELDAEVDAVVETLKRKPPRILKKLKEGVYDAAEQSPAAGRQHLSRVAHESVRTDPEHREGVEAQREGRDPEWVR